MTGPQRIILSQLLTDLIYSHGPQAQSLTGRLARLKLHLDEIGHHMACEVNVYGSFKEGWDIAMLLQREIFLVTEEAARDP